jgi:hypothetical protein
VIQCTAKTERHQVTLLPFRQDDADQHQVPVNRPVRNPFGFLALESQHPATAKRLPRDSFRFFTNDEGRHKARVLCHQSRIAADWRTIFREFDLASDQSPDHYCL